ncbi:hypothetical protein AMTR_s00011p00212740 [Amborella trichopoda]|uniref:Uncharacterized protein n=1 Tax=Amborella trichopoda TaxID=13333 RepID=W1NGT9_AMBTC|nr:hypothetical protein AMTR_s00011p00212740 [Amborella trichopoda]
MGHNKQDLVGKVRLTPAKTVVTAHSLSIRTVTSQDNLKWPTAQDTVDLLSRQVPQLGFGWLPTALVR